eukprot:COSAG03_NODE_466_length_7684_cov_6.536454_5_plen_152_part_00
MIIIMNALVFSLHIRTMIITNTPVGPLAIRTVKRRTKARITLHESSLKLRVSSTSSVSAGGSTTSENGTPTRYAPAADTAANFAASWRVGACAASRLPASKRYAGAQAPKPVTTVQRMHIAMWMTPRNTASTMFLTSVVRFCKVNKVFFKE